MPYRQHLSTSSDLTTSQEEIRTGFIALALEKSRLATPIVEQVRALRVSAMSMKQASDLMKDDKLKPALLAAAGVSNKAARHMLARDKDEAIARFVRSFLEPAGNKFVEELVYRFLLTRGDTLGGAMRNIGGLLAQRKLTIAIIAVLNATKTSCYFLHKRSGVWSSAMCSNNYASTDIKAISWSSEKSNRTLVYDITVPIVRKNIDICLLDCHHQELTAVKKISSKYLALGELKGGIDPAGADEHWKTANSALSRIRDGFDKNHNPPCLFFVGAVIVSNMATEIWSQLEAGNLKNAANLTRTKQVTSLCSWLCSL